MSWDTRKIPAHQPSPPRFAQPRDVSTRSRLTATLRARYSARTSTTTTNAPFLTFFSKHRFEVCLALVVVLFGCHVWFKTTKIFAHPTWDAADDTGQFWSEFAVHYRFAKFFAEHPVGDWGQLSRDRRIQHPDELNSWSEFTVVMEAPCGVAYRWLKPAMPFHEWVVWYSCVVSSLALFGIFFLARALWRSDWAGLLAALLYATIYPSYGRTVKNLFLKEDFAIPLIVFALFFTVLAIQSACRAGMPEGFPAKHGAKSRLTSGHSRPTTQIVAAFFWLAALASWHLTQFLLAVFVAAMAIHFLWRNETPRLPWLVGLLAVGGLLIPSLNTKQFILSPAMCVLYALACVAWANETRASRLFVFSTMCAAFLLLGYWSQTNYGEYSHVYQLFVHKLVNLGVKPDDPALLPLHARLLWEGAFNTAPLSEFWRSLQWCLPFAVIAAVAALYERRKSSDTEHGGHRPPLQIFAIFAILLFPLSWMVLRYFTFLGFAAAVVAAGVWSSSFSLLQNKIAKIAIVVVGIVACAWQFFTLDLRPLDRGSQPSPADIRPVVEWIQKNTTPDAVILATIADSPVYLAHTGRPTVMHSKFENERIRLRWSEMLAAIYSDEETFYAFARKYHADIFIFDWGFVAEGLAPQEFKETRIYKAGLRALPPACAARSFYERPEQLKRFKLEVKTDRFTIFRVID